jgi:single-stranded DNA-specific DHH superfamily exonuclease
MAKRLKRPRDPISLAKLIGDIATGQVADVQPDDGKNPAAVALGKKGGQARAANLSKKKRSQIAKNAARARWKADK